MSIDVRTLAVNTVQVVHLTVTLIKRIGRFESPPIYTILREYCASF